MMKRHPWLVLAALLFLHVIAHDLPAFQRIYDDQLTTLPGVQRLSSTLVMKTVVEDKPLPL